MAQNYIRQSSFTDGDTITAGLFNNEYNQLVNAFAYSSIDANATGHTHDGSLGQGGNISKIGDLDFLNKIEIDGTNNRMGFFVEVGGVTTEQVRISDGLIVPVTTNDIDLGSASLQFKDAYFDGTVNIDSLVADTADVNGGTVDNVTIGGTTPAVATFTTANATTVDTTNIEVTNIKAKDGTAAGSIADSTGVVTLASSVLTTADINGGTLDAVTIGATTAAEITGTTITYGSLSDGTITITAFVDEDDMISNSATLVPTQQSVKAYVDAQVTAQDLDIVGDTGTDAIDLDSETLTFTGGTGITSVVTAGTVTHNIDSTVATLTGTQTLTNKTINADNNTVSNLEVDNLKTGVLDTDLTTVSSLHDTIPSAKAVYDYVADLAGSTDPIFTGTVTADNVTINGNTILGSDAADTLTVNANSTFNGTVDIGSGTIDGTVIGGTTAAAGSFTTITVSGTVDGRDVAADGTKLDGIEALADVTDTANVTAAGALMDSEVTNLAAVKAFDPADYATAAQGSLADSALQDGDTVASLTLTTADINGGTIDGSVIGGTTAAAGTFTALSADNLNVGVYSLTGTDIDHDNGAIQYKTLAANTTFTESLADGDSVILRLSGADTYTVTWPTMTWVTGAGNAAPTLGGSDVVVLWQESSTVYGAYVGSYA